MSEKKADPDPSYAREDLSFVKEPPQEISVECPIIMSTDNVKGYISNNLWTSFLYFMYQDSTRQERILSKVYTSYQIFPDADRQHIISGLQCIAVIRKMAALGKKN